MQKAPKYRIKELIYSRYLLRKERAEEVRRLANKLGIAENHLRKIWAYPIDSPHEAKPSQLQMIAEEYGVSVEDLMN